MIVVRANWHHVLHLAVSGAPHEKRQVTGASESGAIFDLNRESRSLYIYAYVYLIAPRRCDL